MAVKYGKFIAIAIAVIAIALVAYYYSMYALSLFGFLVPGFRGNKVVPSARVDIKQVDSGLQDSTKIVGDSIVAEQGAISTEHQIAGKLDEQSVTIAGGSEAVADGLSILQGLASQDVPK